ncbi:MAG TPA: hypothetical protein VGG48_01985 [Rhizomicrobium sp.]|jgi:hypothetical protein
MRSTFGLSLLGALLFALAACGPSDSLHAGGRGNAAGGGVSAVENEKQIVWSDPRLSDPIYLRFGPDQFAKAQQVSSHISGTYDYWSTEPDLAGDGRCGLNPREQQVNATVDVFNFSGTVLSDWLLASGFAHQEAYTVKYTNGPYSSVTFYCIFLQQNVLQYMPGAEFNGLAQSNAYHNGLNVPVARRVCTRWTYANEYEAQTADKGNVKFFAGTFTFQIVPFVPWFSVSGTGTGSAKMYLDPDSGKWVVATLDLQNQFDANLLADKANAPPYPPPAPNADCPGP